MTNRQAALPFLLLLFLSRASAGIADVQGVWQFDDSLANGVSGGAPLVASGFTPVYADELVDGRPIRALDLPALSPTQWLEMPVEGGPNGGPGSTLTNQWTLLLDIKVNQPSLDAFGSLLSTRPSGATDTDFFITPDGMLAVDGGQSSPGTIAPATWYRVVLTCGNDGNDGPPVLKAYIDGQPVFTSLPLDLDGNHGLTTAARLFTDDNGETLPLLCNNAAFWHETLPPSDIATLGGPVAEGLVKFTVTNPDDSGPGSLRQAIADAAASPGADVVVFSASLPVPATVSPVSALSINDPGGLVIDASALPAAMTLDGGNAISLIEQTSATSSLLIRRLNLTRASGPAIRNSSGRLVLEDCLLDGNTSTNGGGGLHNSGSALARRSTFSNNSASGSRGGAILHDGGTLSLVRCTLDGNSSSSSGGAIHGSAPLALEHCTITRNTATTAGGGIHLQGSALSSAYSIISGNMAPAATPRDITNTNGTFTRTGNNLVAVLENQDAGAGNPPPSDSGPPADTAHPLLAPLGRYGSSVPTAALQPSSPARDQANGSTSTADQRGLPMVGVPDLGSYEAGNESNYDTWIWELLPPSFTEAQPGPDQDADGDGMSNHAEWVAGTSPTDPSSVCRILDVIPTPGEFGMWQVDVTFPSLEGRTYQIQFSTDLRNWETRDTRAGNGAVQTSSAIIVGNRAGFARIIISR